MTENSPTNENCFRSRVFAAHLLGVRDKLVQIASNQHGLLSRAQLDSSDVSPDQLRSYVRSGRLHKVAPRVYAIAGVPDSKDFQLQLGLLSLDDESWVSYEAAASLHGLDRRFRPPSSSRSNARDVNRSCSSGSYNGNGRSAGSVEVDGFRTLSASRTVIDLAHARRGVRRVEAAIDSAVRLGLSSPLVIATRLETLRGSGRWGCRLIDSLMVDSGGHSMLERRFLQLVREAGIPRPVTQAIHRKGSRHIARVDFLFEEANVVIEVSGQLGHTTPTERARDAQRRNELQDIGRRVLEYTWEDVTQHPEMVTRTLKERLGLTPMRL